MNIILKNNFIGISYALIFAALSSCTAENKNHLTPIFNGQDLKGWHVIGGEATYDVKNGEIIGTTVSNTPNTFLATDATFTDFILDLDFKTDSVSNSGVQIRSNSLPWYRDGMVHGYQVEIDPSKRAWSGGIYDEKRRKWLNPLEDNKPAQTAYKPNDWNHYRIEAIGDTIRTWINDVPAAYLIDDMTKEGFIALQVHSIGAKGKPGVEIKWRNVELITENLEKYSKSSPLEPIITKNNLTFQEQKDGWQMLWDGKTTNGWRGAKSDSFPEKGWKIKNGELSVLASGGGESTAGGDIVTENMYSNFEMMTDFKITEGANSGIKYYVDTELNKGEGSSIGLEFQILDDDVHPDAKLGSHEGSRTVASLYDLIKADTAKHMNPIGEWNTAHIVSKNNKVEHWLNGVKVLEYDRGSEDFLKLVSESKYKDWPNFGLLEKGNILLQDHGDLVSFKNIKIKTYE
ncbi:3-keto-disaccharide hydrolase [Maribacter stanieri]|uniref:3-keto-disaccharide hydrolase n=1 Tax=Maribacter stanieri TaxID=440514 RepID=UPI0024958CAB|nr:DUF1080 domain-containing protein [Maribacter stanieri]